MVHQLALRRETRQESQDCFPEEKVSYEMAQQMSELQHMLSFSQSAGKKGEKRVEGEKIGLIASLGASSHRSSWVAEGMRY